MATDRSLRNGMTVFFFFFFFFPTNAAARRRTPAIRKVMMPARTPPQLHEGCAGLRSIAADARRGRLLSMKSHTLEPKWLRTARYVTA
mmetsp:Transcript_6747/g.5400  ORF Transcript_6747/g.5400 Transcript_6747/m.5400 type:complete len:88 (-) Transcript_6747:138-401(-)